MLALIFLLILETSQDIMTLENGLIPTAGIRKSPKLEVNIEIENARTRNIFAFVTNT